MKTIYVPKGETIHYDSLYADRIVVDGCLRVDHSLDARTIGGKGNIHAGKVSANTIRIGYLDACSVMCKRLLASRVDSPEVFASERMVVSCVLSACLVETPKLTVSLCEVEELKVKDLIAMPAKRRSIFGILFISTFRAIVAAILDKLSKGEAMDADYRQEEVGEEDVGPEAQATEETGPAAEPAPEEEVVDEELNRLVNLFKLLREKGYTLRVVPGTPEENAPVFDFEHGRIVRPAA